MGRKRLHSDRSPFSRPLRSQSSSGQRREGVATMACLTVYSTSVTGSREVRDAEPLPAPPRIPPQEPNPRQAAAGLLPPFRKHARPRVSPSPPLGSFCPSLLRFRLPALPPQMPPVCLSKGRNSPPDGRALRRFLSHTRNWRGVLIGRKPVGSGGRGLQPPAAPI